jgi:hypothetical protein
MCVVQQYQEQRDFISPESLRAFSNLLVLRTCHSALTCHFSGIHIAAALSIHFSVRIGLNRFVWVGPRTPK